MTSQITRGLKKDFRAMIHRVGHSGTLQHLGLRNDMKVKGTFHLSREKLFPFLENQISTNANADLSLKNRLGKKISRKKESILNMNIKGMGFRSSADGTDAVPRNILKVYASHLFTNKGGKNSTLGLANPTEYAFSDCDTNIWNYCRDLVHRAKNHKKDIPFSHALVSGDRDHDTTTVLDYDCSELNHLGILQLCIDSLESCQSNLDALRRRVIESYNEMTLESVLNEQYKIARYIYKSTRYIIWRVLHEIRVFYTGDEEIPKARTIHRSFYRVPDGVDHLALLLENLEKLDAEEAQRLREEANPEVARTLPQSGSYIETVTENDIGELSDMTIMSHVTSSKFGTASENQTSMVSHSDDQSLTHVHAPCVLFEDNESINSEISLDLESSRWRSKSVADVDDALELYYLSSNDDSSFHEWRRPAPSSSGFQPLQIVDNTSPVSWLLDWDIDLRTHSDFDISLQN